MIITKIEEQKKTKNRFNIYIDGEYVFSLGGVDILYFKLSEKAEISQQKFDEIKEFVILEEAKFTACQYTGFKARTKKELEKKMLEKYSEEITAETIEFMEKYGYINDREFALDYAKEKSHLNGWGKRKIVYQLSLKGISRKDIDNMLESGILEENSRLMQLINKKLKGKKEIDAKEKQKLFAFLARKGYGYDEINSAFSEYTSL